MSHGRVLYRCGCLRSQCRCFSRAGHTDTWLTELCPKHSAQKARLSELPARLNKLPALVLPSPDREDRCLTGPPHIPGRWAALCFENSCGRVWRVDSRTLADGTTERRRVEVRRL